LGQKFLERSFKASHSGNFIKREISIPEILVRLSLEAGREAAKARISA
jgi:hypothetical protein